MAKRVDDRVAIFLVAGDGGAPGLSFGMVVVGEDDIIFGGAEGRGVLCPEPINKLSQTYLRHITFSQGVGPFCRPVGSDTVGLLGDDQWNVHRSTFSGGVQDGGMSIPFIIAYLEQKSK